MAKETKAEALDARLSKAGWPHREDLDDETRELIGWLDKGETATLATLGRRGWLHVFDLEDGFDGDGKHSEVVARVLVGARIDGAACRDGWIPRTGRIVSLETESRAEHLLSTSEYEVSGDRAELGVVLAACQLAAELAESSTEFAAVESGDHVARIVSFPAELREPVLELFPADDVGSRDVERIGKARADELWRRIAELRPRRTAPDSATRTIDVAEFAADVKRIKTDWWQNR